MSCPKFGGAAAPLAPPGPYAYADWLVQTGKKAHILKALKNPLKTKHRHKVRAKLKNLKVSRDWLLQNLFLLISIAMNGLYLDATESLSVLLACCRVLRFVNLHKLLIYSTSLT